MTDQQAIAALASMKAEAEQLKAAALSALGDFSAEVASVDAIVSDASARLSQAEKAVEYFRANYGA